MAALGLACSSEPNLPPPATDLTLTRHPALDLIIEAQWDDPGASEAWVEYRFEGDDWLVAPILAPGEAVLLGIPSETAVEARAVSVVDGETLTTSTQTITTGALPDRLPPPLASSFDATIASPERFGLTSVNGDGPFWLQIIDRQGRVVWYQEVTDNRMTFLPHVARDGSHVWFEATDILGLATGEASVRRQTLDNRWSEEWVIADLGQAVSEGPDHSFFFERRLGRVKGANLEHLDAAGNESLVWDCAAAFAGLGVPATDCLMNTSEWDAERNTVLVSQFPISTVFEIDVASGTALRQFGQLAEGDPYTFDPADSLFAYQHYPHWTAEGTLLVSTHAPCAADDLECNPNRGTEGIQRAAEYVVDDATQTLTRIWMYESTDLWATQIGEAYRLPNGNLIQGYGQDGAVREVTPEGAVAWQVQWEIDRFRIVGHLSLIHDLYALNRGL